MINAFEDLLRYFFHNFHIPSWIVWGIIAWVAYKMYSKMPQIEVTDYRWYFPDFQISSKEYYKLVESLHRNLSVPNITYEQINFPEKGIFSSDRQYLRIQKSIYVFDICAAPYGNGSFISWWYGERYDWPIRLLLSIPIIGWFTRRTLKLKTYYQRDEQQVFRIAIEGVISEAKEQICAPHGVRTAEKPNVPHTMESAHA